MASSVTAIAANSILDPAVMIALKSAVKEEC